VMPRLALARASGLGLVDQLTQLALRVTAPDAVALPGLDGVGQALAPDRALLADRDGLGDLDLAVREEWVVAGSHDRGARGSGSPVASDRHAASPPACCLRARRALAAVS